MALLFATWTGDLFALVVALFSFAVWYVRNQFSYWERRNVAFSKPSFPFGNINQAVLQRQSIADISAQIYNEKDVPAIGWWTGLNPSLIIRDPEIIRAILIKDFNIFQDRGVYCDEERDPLSGNLFSMPGETWRFMRQKLTPTFTSGKLKAMFQTLVDCGVPLSDHMIQHADSNNIIEIRELMAQFTTNMIASVAFGLDINCIKDPNTDFRKYGRQNLAANLSNAIRGIVSLLIPDWFKTLGLRSVDRDVEEFFMSVVKQNMELREKTGSTRKDFFQLLVQLRNSGVEADGVWNAKISDKKTLTMNECAAQSFVFYIAGFETSSTTISFALYELARNPECQRRVQKEIDEVLAQHNGELTYESVAAMKYLEMCIDETLRMYPPVPILNRKTNQSWKVPQLDGVVLEKDTPVVIPVYALQHDPKYYPEPKRFIPERFETTKSLIEQPYLPFGDGPRNCIGLRLGKIQTKIGLISMLQKYSYALAGNTLKPLVINPKSFLVSPIGGVHLRVSHRIE